MLNAEQLKAWREQGRDFLAADGAPASANKEQRTVDICWFTGIDVPRIDYWTGDQYILHFDPKGADLTLLNNGAPVLDGHDRWSGTSGQKGRVERAWKDGTRYLATLRFSRRPEVEGLWGDVVDGIMTKFSMGVEHLKLEEVRDKTGRLTQKNSLLWRPFEISCEPIPADWDTSTLSGAGLRPDSAAVARFLARQREQEILKLR